MPDVRMIFIGDTSLQRRAEPDLVFAPNMAVFNQPDIFFCNLETVVADEKYLRPDDPTPATFVGSYPRTDEAMFSAYLRAGINIVNMANNVGLYHGYECFVRSLEVVSASGIAYGGAGFNLAEARRPAIVEKQGVRVAFVCRTSIFPPRASATAKKAGMAVFRVDTSYQPAPRAHEVPGMPPIIRTFPNEDDRAALAEDIQTARQEADVVVVSWHWGLGLGTGGTGQVVEYQREMAHFAVDKGADMVVGHHPNILCPIEIYKDKVIVYSLGMYVHDTASRDGKTADSMILQAVLTDKRITEVSFVPGVINGQGPALYGRPADFAEVVERLRDASAAFGTEFRIRDEAVLLGT